VLKVSREKGHKSVKNCKKTVLALMIQTHEEKLYAKILLKNIENDNDNFKIVAIKLK